MFDVVEMVNNHKKGQKNDFRKGTMSFLFKPGNDSKKKKEKEKIIEEYVLDSYLLSDQD